MAIGRWGVAGMASPQQRRAVLLANRLALFLFVFSFSAGIAIFFSSGILQLSIIVSVISLVYLAVPFINRAGYQTLGRLLICFYLPLSSLGLSIYGKLVSPPVNETAYFTIRMVLLVGVILPLVIFSFRERRFLVSGVLLNFTCLLFYDPIHTWFGVGYRQMGLDVTSYGFMHYIMLVLFLLLVTAFYYYKITLEHAERKIWKNNNALRKLHQEQETQHRELAAKSSELSLSQTKLEEAYKIIAAQNDLLSSENTQLQQHLQEKNAILENNNIELHKSLDELKQFSYTISHNLRGPVATLLGLSKLFNQADASAENRQLMEHITTSALALDTVIRDLSDTLDIQRGGANKEPVDLSSLLNSVLIALEDARNECNGTVQIDLEVKKVQAVKSYMHSILYNLLSNAFKYCDPSRPLVINFRTVFHPHEVLLEIEDNGIGIDLKRHGGNLFKMYRRFSNSRKGRGLGLYLVKMQTESMGGRIFAESQLNVGTTFKLYLPQEHS